MKLIIAGSRHIVDMKHLEEAVKMHAIKDKDVTEIVSGGAYGADYLGEVYAHRHNIPIRRFPAEWRRYGKKAGPIRNREMAIYADALLAIWDGESRGTKNMIQTMINMQKPYYICRI